MKIKIALALLGVLLATHAFAEDERVTIQKDPGQDFTYACNAPDITAHLAEILQARGDDWVDQDVALQQKGKCVGYSPGQWFVIQQEVSSTTDRATYTVDLVHDLAGKWPDLYVLKRNLRAVTDDDVAQRAASACGPAVGGEVARWVTTSDGTLKLKRFMITSKCVNGQMKSFTKRLN